MSSVSRFGVSLEEDLLQAFDLSIGGQGYQNRSEAIREFEAAVRFNPRHAPARRGLGIILMHEDKLEAAVEELRRALRDAPRDEEAANNLGLAQLRLNDVSGVRLVWPWRSTAVKLPSRTSLS